MMKKPISISKLSAELNLTNRTLKEGSEYE